MIKLLSHHADDQEKKELENKGLLDQLCVTSWCKPQKGTQRNVLISILDGDGIYVRIYVSRLRKHFQRLET